MLRHAVLRTGRTSCPMLQHALLQEERSEQQISSVEAVLFRWKRLALADSTSSLLVRQMVLLPAGRIPHRSGPKSRQSPSESRICT